MRCSRLVIGCPGLIIVMKKCKQHLDLITHGTGFLYVEYFNKEGFQVEANITQRKSLQ
jgi:hypothetical protein